MSRDFTVLCEGGTTDLVDIKRFLNATADLAAPPGTIRVARAPSPRELIQQALQRGFRLFFCWRGPRRRLLLDGLARVRDAIFRLAGGPAGRPENGTALRGECDIRAILFRWPGIRRLRLLWTAAAGSVDIVRPAGVDLVSRRNPAA